jgi:hypothetical protein
MVDTDQLSLIVNALGCTVMILVVAYHFLDAKGTATKMA